MSNLSLYSILCIKIQNKILTIIPLFSLQTAMSSCSVGFMLGKAYSHGKSPVLKALLETYIPGKKLFFFHTESFSERIQNVLACSMHTFTSSV